MQLENNNYYFMTEGQKFSNKMQNRIDTIDTICEKELDLMKDDFCKYEFVFKNDFIYEYRFLECYYVLHYCDTYIIDSIQYYPDKNEWKLVVKGIHIDKNIQIVDLNTFLTVLDKIELISYLKDKLYENNSRI
jgi:hypothetical protein